MLDHSSNLKKTIFKEAAESHSEKPRYHYLLHQLADFDDQNVQYEFF